ncbi:hypothetical protein T484DRAFT_1904920 [Baffinella frigidus]|nr:hypothetical protein T484DRAFT_1904920 [Cryptophyta sp. CCMP2293]
MAGSGDSEAHTAKAAKKAKAKAEGAWNSPAGRLVNARVTGHADAEANCPR